MAQLLLVVGVMTAQVVSATGNLEQEGGDHVVILTDHADGTIAQATMGEAEAMKVVGAWLNLETEFETPRTREVLRGYFGAEVEAFLP